MLVNYDKPPLPPQKKKERKCNRGALIDMGPSSHGGSDIKSRPKEWIHISPESRADVEGWGSTSARRKELRGLWGVERSPQHLKSSEAMWGGVWKRKSGVGEGVKVKATLQQAVWRPLSPGRPSSTDRWHPVSWRAPHTHPSRCPCPRSCVPPRNLQAGRL